MKDNQISAQSRLLGSLLAHVARGNKKVLVILGRVGILYL